MTYRIGIDLGGTKTESILLDPRGAELHRHRRPTPAAAGYEAILDNIQVSVNEALALIPEAHARGDCRVGVGIPGMVGENHLVRNANTTVLNGRPLRLDLEKRLGRTIQVENDANCFVVAEAMRGAGRPYELVFGVIMGTGCGGGIFQRDSSGAGGRVLRGRHGIGGEWGHISLDPAGAPCYCGNRGCVETMISGSGMERAFRESTGRELSMREIHAGFVSGDGDCIRAFERFLDDFGRALGGLISILDPDVVVLGGGLSSMDELYDRGLKKVVQYAFHEKIETPILRNELGDSAGVHGAAWL